MFEIENVYYEKAINGIAVCGVSENFDAECLILKEEVDGLPVTKICANTFQDIQTLTKISIPQSIYIIENSAFRNCTNLKTVVFFRKKTQPPVVLDSCVFQNCKKLNAVKGQSRLNLIGSFVFDGCESLENMPTGVYGSIPRMTFTKCPKLRTLFMHYVKEVEAGAFDSQNNIETVVVLNEFEYTCDFIKSIKDAKIMCKRGFKIAELGYSGYRVVLLG